MEFNNLKEKCNYYRSLTDYKIDENKPILLMLDGRSFSHNIKKKFKLPFDKDFINMMNETAIYVCEKVQGVKFGYVQSDEISLFATKSNENSDIFFNGRLTKILSIVASIATGYFNKLLMLHYFNNDIKKLEDFTPLQFDCKCWNVENKNDVYAWFLFRQLDCIKNSKAIVAQSHYTYKELLNLHTDEMIDKLLKEKNISWYNDFNDGEKYGRFIYKEEIEFENEYGKYTRNKFLSHDGFELNNNRNKIYDILGFKYDKQL